MVRANLLDQKAVHSAVVYVNGLKKRKLWASIQSLFYIYDNILNKASRITYNLSNKGNRDKSA